MGVEHQSYNNQCILVILDYHARWKTMLSLNTLVMIHQMFSHPSIVAAQLQRLVNNKSR